MNESCDIKEKIYVRGLGSERVNQVYGILTDIAETRYKEGTNST